LRFKGVALDENECGFKDKSLLSVFWHRFSQSC
jgi:hypothetical protein